jgi:hypothetical protein
MKRLLLVVILLSTHVSLCAPTKKGAPAPAQQSSPIVVEVRSPAKSDAEIAADARKERNQENTNRWSIILTGIIAFAALVQVGGLIGQIVIYRRQARIMSDSLNVAADQAKAAEVAATASQQSTEALMNGDRAWISVVPAIIAPELHPVWEPGDPEPKDPQFMDPFHHGFPILIKNVGKTPARIEKVYTQYVFLQRRPELLEDEPAYIDAMKEQSFLLIPNDETPVMTYLTMNAGLLTKGEVSAIHAQAAFLYAYGVINYKDVYDRAHETRFGYVYHFPDAGFVNIERTGFRRGGPEAYNRQT